MENGFRMYLEAKGGKLGGRTVEVVVADEGGGPDTGVPAAQKLLQQDRVTTLVGIVNSAVALGVRDLATDGKVPLIIANAGANAITGELRSDYVWRTSFTNGEVAGALGEHVARGVALVLQGRRATGPWTPGWVYELLPQLAERRRHRADQVSGGEQQMLAVARALLLNPRRLLLDEPSDGLAPSVVARVAGLLSDLRDQGLAILLVEQDLRTAFAVADEVAVMRKGEIAHRSPTLGFRRNAALASRLLGI
jgi:branched-chain amino acid transport system ATP-binding protein